MADELIDDDDAIKLERAAMVILHVVKQSKHGGSERLRASFKLFPGSPLPGNRRLNSLAAAKRTLNMSKAWRDA